MGRKESNQIKQTENKIQIWFVFINSDSQNEDRPNLSFIWC